MISVLPLHDDSRKARLLQDFPEAAPDGQVLLMCDGSEELGFVILDLAHSILRIHHICVHGDDPGGMLADFLMRSAASYAANFGAYQIELYDQDFFAFFCARGFVQKEAFAAIPMSGVVRVEKPGR